MSLNLDIQTLSVMALSASVVISALYYMVETRHQRRIRQTESIVHLSPWFNIDAEAIQDAISNVRSMKYTDYKDFLEKYDGKPEQKSLRILGNYFEGVGLLVHMKLVELEIPANFWGDVAVSIWDSNVELIDGMRKDTGTQWTFEYWEFLVKEIKKRYIALSKKK